MNLWQRIVNLVARPKPGEERIYLPYRQAGVTVTEDTALTLAEWWACVSVISRTIAALPWHVYQKTGAGREPVDGTVSWLLNNRPNPEMSAFSFREVLMSHVLNWGNAYAEIERDMAGRVMSLWPLPPDRVEPKRTAAGALVYEVRAEGGQAYLLQPESVFHLHGMGFDGIVGYSPVRMAARSIGVGIAQDTFAGAFYQNGTQMGATVELPANMSAAQIKDTEAYYNEAHGGPAKAFRVKVAAAGTKVHAMGMPLNDAQFIESRAFTVTMAARWLGVPPHKIADLSRSTNNNIEHQGIEFVTDAIVPWATRLEQEANAKLFGARAQGHIYTRLNVNGLMRGDAKSRAEFYRTMTQIGAMSINEVRALEEMNGIGPDGDQYLVQLNQTTLDKLVNAPEPQPAAAPALAPPDDDTEDEPAAPTNVIRAEALAFWRNQA